MTHISYATYKAMYSLLKQTRDDLYTDFIKENLIEIRVLEAALDGLDCELSTEDYRRLMDEAFWRATPTPIRSSRPLAPASLAMGT